MAAAPLRLLPAVTRVEPSFAIEGRKQAAGRADLERLLPEGAFQVMPVTPRQAAIAIDGFVALAKAGTGRG